MSSNNIDLRGSAYLLVEKKAACPVVPKQPRRVLMSSTRVPNLHEKVDTIATSERLRSPIYPKVD